MTKTIKLTDFECAYLAGLFEGEAAFTQTVSNGTIYPRIYLGMTDMDVVEKVAAIFGTNVRKVIDKRPNNKPLYQMVLCKSQMVCDTLKQLLPHMSKRRSERMLELLQILKDRNIEPTIV